MNTKELTRKEKEKIFKRSEIMEAACSIFSEKGFRDTTLDEIATTAEFGKGTIYNYFDNKEDIYSAIIHDVSNNLSNIFKEADSVSTDVKDFITNYTRLLFKYCFSNKDAFIIYVREIVHFTTDIFISDRTIINERHEDVKNLLIKKFESGMRKKEFKRFDPVKLTLLFEHLIFPFILCQINCSEGEIDQEKEMEFLLSIFFNGIINNKKQAKH